MRKVREECGGVGGSGAVAEVSGGVRKGVEQLGIVRRGVEE